MDFLLASPASAIKVAITNHAYSVTFLSTKPIQPDTQE